MQGAPSPMRLTGVRLCAVTLALVVALGVSGLGAIAAVAQDPPDRQSLGGAAAPAGTESDDPCSDEVAPPPPPPVDESEEQAPPPPPLEEEAVPPCGVSYQARSIPGVRTWIGACIEALDRGPIVLAWKDATPGATTTGVFTLDPSSETEGTLTGALSGKGPNWSLKGRTKGTSRIEVSGTHADGSPSELLVVHSMTESIRNRAGGRCTTSKADLGEGTIPLDVLSGSCPVAP